MAEEGEVVILTQVESREIVRAITRAGGRASMTSSGLGKAISATYSTEDISAIIRRHGMIRMTPKSIVKANEFDKELKRIRLQGYAIDDEEVSMGLRCIAAVIYDEHSEVLAAISASGPITRIPNERIAQLGKIVTDAANEITLNLGGQLPK
jgi:IclR family acetate operon transcriptional repressor